MPSASDGPSPSKRDEAGSKPSRQVVGQGSLGSSLTGGPLEPQPNPSRLAKTHALGVCGGTSLSLSTTADRPPCQRRPG